MKLLQVSNLVSHHQLPLARRLAAVLGENCFRFAATQPPCAERSRMGWTGEFDERWILRAGETAQAEMQFRKWWDQADVVLCGERLFSRMTDRLNERKITFNMTERWWKPPIGMARLLHPQFALMSLHFRRMAASPFFHFMPAGVYAASDIKRLSILRNRMWLWGYFTDVSEPLLVPRKGGNIHVLWAGRMLGWKRVDILLRGFRVLLHQHKGAMLTLIGDGPCREPLKKLAKELNVTNAVSFLPSMPVSEVRGWMRNVHIYAFPSSGTEGWGAVVNEAMTEGVAIVASEAAGSSKTMIRNGENGLLVRPGNWMELGDSLCRLAADEPLRLRLAQAGQQTIATEWCPQIAAERFCQVSDALLSGKRPPQFDTGPMMQMSK